MTIQYEGGYFMIPEPLVRGYGPNAHTARDLSLISNYAVEAVNLIQDTPWQINPMVLDIITTWFDAKKDVTVDSSKGPEVILRLECPVNPKKDPENLLWQKLPDERWEAMTTAERKEFKAKRYRSMKVHEEELGVYQATDRMINTAIEMSRFEKFYFPHNMDFRTRIYPIPTDLTPQSNDLSKGLLRFARPKPLGQDGLFWLGFAVASHWGEDKLSPQERFDYAIAPEFFAQCAKWVDAPLEDLGWLKADAPFQFIAAVHEFVWAIRSGNPQEFLGRVPVNLDGSCNGAQHLSILSRDTSGAESTNCRAKRSRKDLYMEVGNIVWANVEREAAEGNPMALEWVPKLMNPSDRRKVVKRAVMTVPYGVTAYGVADQIIKDKHVDTAAANQWDSAKYIRDKIMDAVENALASGRSLQRWFQACATICAEAGMPLVWETPAGSKVTQAYRNLVAKRIKSYSTEFLIYEEPTEDETKDDFLTRIGMDVKKMGTAAPPNVIHSCDASHLQITTVRCGDVGIRDFSMIHDSFGTHACDVGLMRDILRQSIVDMYADNYLLKWKESVERYSGLRMPEPPPLGDFDITEILESEFFFS